MNEIDLNEYFSKARNGDKGAFVIIYNSIKQPVFAIAYRIVQVKEIAEDITHDVFVKLYISPPDSSVRNPRAWIFQMARNLSIDALRKNHCTELEEDLIVLNEDFEQISLQLDIESAIAKLPCIEREILSLYLNGELGFNEISHIVGLSLPSTYRKYRKALKTLRYELNGGAL